MEGVALRDVDVQFELQWLRDTVRESYGPLGRLSLLQPFPGAELTCTNRSCKLLQLLKPASPVIKLLLSSLQLHCQHFKDATLYATLLSINLILKGLELPYSQYKVAMVTGYVLSEVCNWLKSVCCPAKRHLSLSSTGELMALVKTHLASKMTVYGLTNTQLEHISSLLLQGFLRVAPSNSEECFSFADHLHILSCPGHAVHESLLLAGIVFPRTTDDPLPSAVRRCRDGSMLVALFDISLAGDLEEFPVGVSLEAEPSSGLASTAFDDVIIDKLMGVASHLVDLGVGLLGCQKCVHPQIKDYFRQKGVYVLERVSSLHIGPLRSLTGAQPLSSLSDGMATPPSSLGKLKELRQLTALGETYLQLEGVRDDHCSILLTSHLKTTVDEMTALCHDTVCILEQTLRSPHVFYGGGCMETITAHHLMRKANEVASDDVLLELQCNQKTLSAVTLSIAESFIAMALCLDHDKGTVTVDSTYHHCWSRPPTSEATPTSTTVQSCRCGAVTSIMLPADCSWSEICVATNILNLEPGKKRINDRDFPPGIPAVCDCYTAKLRATELTGDIASTVLQTTCIATVY